MKKSFGLSVVSMYFLFYYFLPMFGLAILGDESPTIYMIYPMTIYSNVLLFGTFLTYLYLLTKPPVRIPIPILKTIILSTARKVGVVYSQFRLIFALVFVVMAAIFASSGMSDYRTISGGMSQRVSWLGWATIIMNMIAALDLFYCVFVRAEELKRIISIGTRPYSFLLSRTRIETILLAIAIMLSANGAASLIASSVFLVFSFSPLKVHGFIFSREKKSVQDIMSSGYRIITAILIFAAIFIFAWSVGEMIKHQRAGGEGVVSAVEIIFSKEFVSYLVVSISNHYYSLTFLGSSLVGQYELFGISSLNMPLSSFLYRIDMILGGVLDVGRPAIESFTRLNFIELTQGRINDARQGTSAGVIATFSYAFIFPLNMIFCAIYLVWVSNLVDRLLVVHHEKKLTLVGSFVLTILYLVIFFQSPLDMLIIVDNVVITAFILYVISLLNAENHDQAKTK